MRLLLLLLVPLVAEATILKAINSTMVYFAKLEKSQITANVVFDIILLDGQLNALKSVYKDIEKGVDQILEACETFIKNNDKILNLTITKDMVERVRESVKLLMTGEIKTLNISTSLPYELENNLRHGLSTLENSVECLFEVVMKHEESDLCKKYIIDSDAKGYSLSHQGLYYTVVASSLSLSLVEKSIREKCEKMFSEVTYAWENEMPPELRDIAIEEVAVCGISRYQDFLTDLTLDFILSLQLEEGCFSLSVHDPLNKCDTHLSAMSIVALANFLYVEIEKQHSN